MSFRVSFCFHVVCFCCTVAFAKSFLALMKENDIDKPVLDSLSRVGCLTVQQM